jgi:RNA polymerase sporulation-specific sigma factor
MTDSSNDNLTGDNFSDEQLVALFQKGDKASGDEIITRYKSKVLSTARKFFLLGGETDDLVQEGLFGLYSAMISYDNTFSASFSTYAYACIKNRILDAVKAAGSLKNSPLNNFLPIVDYGDEEYLSTNPEDRVLDNEAESEFFAYIKKLLSPFEYKVLLMYIEGNSISEISQAMQKTNKSVDNAIMRAKRKLQKNLKAEE